MNMKYTNDVIIDIKNYEEKVDTKNSYAVNE